MATITPELRQELREAGEQPIRMEDPETKTAYLLVREDVYRKLRERFFDDSDESLYEFEDYKPL